MLYKVAEEETKLSKYEKAKILGSRALQISMGAPILVKLSEEDLQNINYNPVARSQEIMWSGIFIDDVRVTAETIGEEVWSDTMIIPGPMEPCDTVEVQFEWEDLPYSNYLICVSSEPEGACGNLEDSSECAQIKVVTDLERVRNEPRKPQYRENRSLSDSLRQHG